jgi:hypothetical protein
MAGASISEKNYIKFTVADQEEVGLTFRITGIAWIAGSGANQDIADGDDMLLEDGAGIEIIGKKAGTADDELVINGLDITVTGLKAEDLDGGVLYVFGERL